MPTKRTFSPQNRDLLVSQKMMQRHFFPTLHPLSPVIFATSTVVAFVLLRNSRFNFHCYTQHEAMPTQKVTSHDLLRERLQRAFTRANQAELPNTKVWAASLGEVLDSFLSTNDVWLVIYKMIGTVLSLQMVWGWFFPRGVGQFSLYQWCLAGSLQDDWDNSLPTNGVRLVFWRAVGTVFYLVQKVWQHSFYKRCRLVLYKGCWTL